MEFQIKEIQKDIDRLHKKHGDKNFTPLYGTGCIKNPKVLFLFMNPTAKNLTVHKSWEGIRAPWIGLKNTWRLMKELGFINSELNEKVRGSRKEEWNHEFAIELYSCVAKNKGYLTNLARCTQPDARHVSDVVFRESLAITLREIELINPKIIISFGNQVSTNLLGYPIKVSETRKQKHDLRIGKKTYTVYPTFYPVGMGLRNMSKAIEDIKFVMKSI
jgi:DNA polymerase